MKISEVIATLKDSGRKPTRYWLHENIHRGFLKASLKRKGRNGSYFHRDDVRKICLFYDLTKLGFKCDLAKTMVDVYSKKEKI